MYRRLKADSFTREDHYLAQIALEVAKGRVKHPNSLKLETYLLKFKTVARTAKPPPITQEEKKQHIKNSKSVWSGYATMWQKPKRGRKKKK